MVIKSGSGCHLTDFPIIVIVLFLSLARSHTLCTSRVAGLKLFTKFNKIYHRLGTRAHAGNFIVVNSLEHSKRVPMKRHGEEDTLLNVCNSCHLDRVLDHLDGVHTNHEEILPQ